MRIILRVRRVYPLLILLAVTLLATWWIMQVRWVSTTAYLLLLIPVWLETLLNLWKPESEELK